FLFGWLSPMHSGLLAAREDASLSAMATATAKAKRSALGIEPGPGASPPFTGALTSLLKKAFNHVAGNARDVFIGKERACPGDRSDGKYCSLALFEIHHVGAASICVDALGQMPKSGWRAGSDFVGLVTGGASGYTLVQALLAEDVVFVQTGLAKHPVLRVDDAIRSSGHGSGIGKRNP